MICPAPVHDSMTAKKTHGCLCPAAHRATTHYEKRLRSEHARGQYRLVEVTGARRRLQALCAIGYSQPELARRLGISQARVWQYLEGPRPTIRRLTATRIAHLYRALADTPSTGPRAGRARATARRHGWLEPLWWDDDTIDDPAYVPPTVDDPRPVDDVDPVIVDRLARGDRQPDATPAERVAAFDQLRSAQRSYTEICALLNLSGSAYQALRERADAAGIEEAA